MVVGLNSITSSTLHLSVTIKAISPYSSEYNSLVWGSSPATRILSITSGSAGDVVASRGITSAGNTHKFAFSRLTGRKPICLPSYVVIGLSESQALSQAASSIHDYGPEQFGRDWRPGHPYCFPQNPLDSSDTYPQKNTPQPPNLSIVMI